MAKLEIAVEVADDNILGKVAKVEETRRAFNNAWADLMNCFTAKYGTAYGNPATVKENARTRRNGRFKHLVDTIGRIAIFIINILDGGFHCIA